MMKKNHQENPSVLDDVFARYKECHQDAAQLIQDLISQIRPPKPQQTEEAVKSIQALCYLLSQDAEKAELLRTALVFLLSECKPISLFLVTRQSVFSGFFSEMRRRISHKILPAAVDKSYLMDLFALFFHKSTDEEWVNAVPDAIWSQLMDAMRFDLLANTEKFACKKNVFAAAQVLSYRITTLGLEPELLRNHPELEQYTSPFITQQTELAAMIAQYEMQSEQDQHRLHQQTIDQQSTIDIKHILVMLDQSKVLIAKIRRNSAQNGTSIHLTQLLQTLLRQVGRLEVLLTILSQIQEKQSANAEIARLFKALVYAECHKNDLHEHWRENIEVMALRVTENASRTGEHYIAENRAAYFSLMRSAMGAGFIIAVMAMLKISVAKQHLAPLTEAILFSLNYGLGFIVIHLLHFTVATKQPAMTAAAIASTIDMASDSKSKEMDHLVAMIAKTIRSQVIAIIGNVIVVVPTAMLLAWSYLYFSGHPFISVEKAHVLLADLKPITGGAVIFAGIAGVCLFLSGLIAGYHDNLAIYNRVPQRLRAVRWLQKWLGVPRLARVANYVENNLGALAGNFYFGCLLGGMSGLGILLGLPIDIRHIAFSSAFVGYASVTLDFMFTWQAVGYICLCLALIALTNLTVSFSLALYVAMKSKKVRFGQWRLLVISLAKRINTHPGEFIFPPKTKVDHADNTP